MNRINTIIVDDHGGFRRILKNVFSDYDCINVVAEAASGEDTLRCARRVSPDLVTVDIHLPGMDGFKLARILRKRYPGTNLVFISFNGSVAYRREAARLGIPYIAKEALLDELPGILENLENNTTC